MGSRAIGIGSKMRESAIEAYLVEQVRKVGGEAYKFTSPGRRNVPDRICIFDSGSVVFVECKATGEKPTPAQLREISRLKELRMRVKIINSKEQVDELVLIYPVVSNSYA